MIDLKTKKILVTGASGFIGKHIVKNLIEKRGVPEKNIFAASFPEYDFTRQEDCRRAVEGKDIILHLAGLTGGIDFHIKNPGKIFYDNLVMNVNLMEEARKAGAEKFTGAGSATEYPENSPMPFSEKNIWDGYPGETHAPYSFAKKMMIVQGEAYFKQYGFKSANPLFSNIYGPGMDVKSGYVISSLIEKIKEAKKENKDFIEVRGSGAPARDFLYVEDAVEGFLLSAEKCDFPEPVNISSGEETSIKNLAGLIAGIMDYKGEIRWDASKPDGQMRRVSGISLAKEALGFQPKTSLEEGLKNTIKWHLENNN